MPETEQRVDWVHVSRPLQNYLCNQQHLGFSCYDPSRQQVDGTAADLVVQAHKKALGESAGESVVLACLDRVWVSQPSDADRGPVHADSALAPGVVLLGIVTRLYNQGVAGGPA
jgi:hypothetical protein